MERGHMGKNLLQEVGKELMGKCERTLLEGLINCFIDNPIDFTKNLIELIHQTKSIPDMILWNNFYLFLQEGNFNYDILRRLAERLEESGNKQENATNIVYAINRIDDQRKAKYLSWLTLSLINNDIDFDDYFRLIKAVENLVHADLIYLSNNVEKIRIDLKDAHIDDFLSNGLIYSIDGGYAYSDKAYNLVEYGIRRGDKIRRPEVAPGRQIFSVMQDDEMDKMFEK